MSNPEHYWIRRQWHNYRERETQQDLLLGPCLHLVAIFLRNFHWQTRPWNGSLMAGFGPREDQAF